MSTHPSVADLARRFAARELTVEAHLDATLAAIDARNASLCIYTALDRAGARDAARASDARRAAGALRSALDGVIVAVKDNIDVAGLPTTAGLGFWRDRIAARDAFAVARLRDAGAIVLGKVNMHAAAFGATNHNADFGDCANPASPGRVPGGSSGGSAAAVAAGWAQLALGTDTMGSVRIPASYCGVTGIKPTRGLVSNGGVVPLCTQLDQVGVLAGCTADVAVAMGVVAGFDPAHSLSQRIDGASVPPRALRVRAPAAPAGTAIEPGVWQRFEAALGSLAARGVGVERFDVPAHDLGTLRRAGLLLSEAEMLVTFDQEWRAMPQRFPAGLRAALEWVSGKSALDVIRAWVTLQGGVTRLRGMQGEADGLLLPTAPQVPFDAGAPVPANQADLTCLANIAGTPAASVPMPCANGELPLGLQVIGAPGADAIVLALCATYEAAATP